MKARWMFLLCLLLAGCASTPVALAPPPALANDTLFHSPSDRIDTSELFALNPAMRAYLEGQLRSTSRFDTMQRRLLEALYRKSDLKLDYDSTSTRPAAATFDAKAGNCLSLVIMTAAFAKELGLEVRFQNVLADETWSRNGGLYFASTHVNISLGRRALSEARVWSESSNWVTIDFLPPEEVAGYRTEIVDEDTLVAMYINNRAAEAMARGELDNAYWWARSGVTRFPQYGAIYNTLGVLYLRHGNHEEAERTLRFALARDAKNTIAMGNLIQVLRASGKLAEADQMAARMKELDPHPAFQYFDRGVVAMKNGDYRSARDDFAREVRRAPYYHEFHFWLALAAYKLGELGTANEQLALAMETSTTPGDRSRYSSKLEHLRGHQ